MLKLKKWQKRTIGLLLMLSMLGSLIPTEVIAAPTSTVAPIGATSASNPFKDVRSTDWFYDAVQYAQQNGIFSGTSKDMFSPRGTMTRAMYVTVLGRIAGVDVSKYTTSAFSDVLLTAWYAPYMQWAVENDITSGTSSDKFSPNATLSREMMATLTLRYFESQHIAYQSSNSVTTQPNDIADVSLWARDAVLKLWQAGVLTGDQNGNFNPKSSATRAEAAAFSMRSNEVVKAWAGNNQISPTPTPTLNPSGQDTGSDGGDNPGGSTPAAYTIKFESNGGTAVSSLMAKQGEALNKLPVPMRNGFIFQGWYRDSGLTRIFADGSTVNANTMLYAKYVENISDAVQSIPSVTLLDQAPNFTIHVLAANDMTLAQVEEGMIFESLDNPHFAGIVVKGSSASGDFTVKSAAQDGEFEEGDTYRLTLTDANLSFEGQDSTTSIFAFSIHKDEVMRVPLNPDMIYIPFEDVSDMTQNGESIDSPKLSVITTNAGDNGTNQGYASIIGTFEYDGDTVIKVGDIVAIYKGTRPDERELDNNRDGDVAYIRITAVAATGNTYTYINAESTSVFAMPHVLPMSTEADTDGARPGTDNDNDAMTVDYSALDYSDSKYAPLKLSEDTVARVGDYIAFYEGHIYTNPMQFLSYGRITSVTNYAGSSIIEYVEVTLDEVAHPFDFYQHIEVDGSLTDSDETAVEDQIRQQVEDSGFVDQATDYLSTLALQTDAFKQQYAALAPMAAGSTGVKVSVENKSLQVTLKSDTKLAYFPDGTPKGNSAEIIVSADIIIDPNNGNTNKIVIHLSSKFICEMYTSLTINGRGIGDYYIIPDDYLITSNLDVYEYTGIEVSAQIGTVVKSEIVDSNIWKRTQDVIDIATKLKEMMDDTKNTGVNAAILKSRYKSLLENDTAWVSLVNKELYSKSMRVMNGAVEVTFSAAFVVSFNPNLSVGINYNRKAATRYTNTIEVYSHRGTSNKVDLPGNGDSQFTFYVMGTLGLHAGLLVVVKAGFGSVSWDSVGISAEAGLYLKLWGYFYYQWSNTQASKSMGALYLDAGIYFRAAVGAQLGGGIYSVSKDLVNEEMSLYHAGSAIHVDDFSYPQDDTYKFKLVPAVQSQPVPDKLFTMGGMDLTTGDLTSSLYDRANFDIQVDNPDFKYDPTTKTVKFVNPDLGKLDSKGKLVITWKNAPLAFTASPIKRTFQLIWSSQTAFSIDLDPQNGEPDTIITGAYRVAVNAPIPVRQGYTLDGWYTQPNGKGTKTAIPSSMPADDLHLYAHWVANTNTPYTVLHYLFDPNTGASNLAVTDNLTGTTDTEIKISSNKFNTEGYDTGTVSGVYINGDGSTIARIYYKRAKRTIIFRSGFIPDQDTPVTALAGQDISSIVPPSFYRPGYTFTGWSAAIPDTMPNANTYIYAQWTARDDTPYKVLYYAKNVGETGYSLYAEDDYVGTSGSVTQTFSPKIFSGLTYTPDSSSKSVVIQGDGSSVIRFYYARDEFKLTYNLNGASYKNNIPSGFTYNPNGDVSRTYLYGEKTIDMSAFMDTGSKVFAGWSPNLPDAMPAGDLTVTAQWKTSSYTVSHYKQDTDGKYTILADKETFDNIAIGTAVEANPKSYTGFTESYDVSIPGTLYKGTVGSDTLELKVYYPRRIYIVTFDLNGGTTDGGTTSGSKSVDVMYGTGITAPVVTRDGYIFDGWSPSLPAIYDSNAGTSMYVAKWKTGSYTVQHIQQGLDGNYSTTADTEEISDIALNTTVTATPKTYEGFTYDSSISGTVRSGTVTTSPLVLKLYYKRKTYKVTFDLNGGTTSGSTTADVYYGASIPVPEVTKDGYDFNGWSPSVPVAMNNQSPVTYTAQWNQGRTLFAVKTTAQESSKLLVGNTISAITTFSDDPADTASDTQVSYQWRVETGQGSGIFMDATGAGNKTKTYTIAEADAGKKLQVVATAAGSASGKVTSGETSAVIYYVSGVTIDNTSPLIGNTLNATVMMANDYTYTTGRVVNYQWEVETEAGSGIYQNATGSGNLTATYKTVLADFGKKLRVVVNGYNIPEINYYAASGSQTSAATNAVGGGFFEVTIDNSYPLVGQTLIASVTMGDGGASDNRVTYQWQVEAGSDTYEDATGAGNKAASYTVAGADVGKKLRVVVTGVGSVTGTQTVTTGAVSNGVSVESVEFVWGKDVNVTDSLIITKVTMDDGNPTGDRVSYQWQLETGAGTNVYENVPSCEYDGFTAPYCPKYSDYGKRLRIVVTGVNGVSGTQAATSNPFTVAVTRVNIDNMDPKVGDTIHASVIVVDGTLIGNRATYKWQVEGYPGSEMYIQIPEADVTSASFTIPAKYAGRKILVQATGTNGASGTRGALSNAVQLADNTIDTFIATAQGSGLTLEKVSNPAVANTEVRVSGPVTLSSNLTVPEGVTLIISGAFEVAAGAKLIVEGTVSVQNPELLVINGNIELNNIGTVILHEGEIAEEQIDQYYDKYLYWLDNNFFIFNGSIGSFDEFGGLIQDY
jgi:uncharacterized repeat protein (TIGR02543 family)